ncbi:MAG: hypothetical protein WCF84_13155 [Anaerolineae bacterium]
MRFSQAMLVSLLFVLAACQSTPVTVATVIPTSQPTAVLPTATLESREAAESAIYPVAIAAQDCGGERDKYWLIHDETWAFPIEDWMYERGGLGRVAAAVDDYKEINARPDQLSHNPALALGYHFITKQEWENTFQSQPLERWQRFRVRFPDSLGTILLSRPGLNYEHTQALIYESCSCGATCGKLRMLFLQRENGIWKVSGTILIGVA